MKMLRGGEGGEDLLTDFEEGGGGLRGTEC